MIELDERKRNGEDPVTEAESEELLPPQEKLDAAAKSGDDPEREEKPEDAHVELPPDQLARMAGIEPKSPEPAEAKSADAPSAAVEAAPEAKSADAPAPAAAEPAIEDAKEAPAAAKDLHEASATLASKAPESEASEEEKEDAAIQGGEFGPVMEQAHDEQKEKDKPADAAQAPVDGKAALAAAAGAAAGVASAAVQEDEQKAKTPAPATPAPKAAPAASASAAPAGPAHDEKAAASPQAAGGDGFAGMGNVGGKQKWNENAYYKHDNTTGFDVGGTKSVQLGKGANGQVDATDAAVYATAAVETSGTYDAINTYDKGILSFGIMQWTLHQGSLMKFLDYLKTKCGDDGRAAFHEHFDALGMDVQGDTLIVGGATIKPDDAGRKEMDKLIRADKDTTRKWVVAFNQAGQDARIARAQWNYTKKQYVETAGKSLEKYTGFARKKGYAAKHAGSYRTPSFWCREPDAAALFFSMTTNNPGYSYYAVIKAADAFMDGAGTDAAKWPDGWPKQFLAIYEQVIPAMIGSWKERMTKTLQHLHMAESGAVETKTAAPAHESAHGPAHAPRPKPPSPTAEAPKKPAPAEVKQAAAAPQPAPEQHSGLSWLADVFTRKVVRGLEEAKTAATHFLGIATTGTPTAAPDVAKKPPPPETKALATKIEQATPKTGKSNTKGKLIPKERLTQGKLSDDQYTFKQKVYEKAVNDKAAAKPIFGALPDEELAPFEGKSLRKDVVPHASSLLGALRSAWHEAKSKGDEKAEKVTEIGISSGYRDPDKDFKLWDDYFQKYYEQTKDAREKTGDPHGAEAVKLLVKYIGGKKAPPGFSNHTGGTAMDMHAIVDGHSLGADASNQKRWFDSWVWHWLTENAGKFNFHPISTEAWHWEWHD